MDGPHDVGGSLGFGPVEREADEPVFHEPWEGRVFAMAGASMLAGLFGTPQFRHAIERMDVVHYLTTPYFEHWLTALATLLVEGGVIDARDLVGPGGAPFPLSRPVHEDPVLFGGPARARFDVDDLVSVVERHPSGHTRCPDYVRGRTGVVVRVDAAANVPSSRPTRPSWSASRPMPSASRAPRCGATTPMPVTRSRSTCTTATWSPCRERRTRPRRSPPTQ